MTRNRMLLAIAIVSVGLLGAGSIIASRACRTGAKQATAGRFDLVMSQVCKYSCAEQGDYDEADIARQPNPPDGRLTRCPVSGVVFTVAKDRPTMTAASGNPYVFCCAQCTQIYQRNPERYGSL